MKFDKRSLTAKAAIATMAVTAAFVVVPAAASHASSGCAVESSVLSGVKKSGASGSYVRGTGEWYCYSKDNVKVTVYHNMGQFVPDAIVTDNNWNLGPSKNDQYQNVQRCDNSTTAAYHADAEAPNEGWLLHSSDVTVTTCSGTGS